ncbi:hypothetical protein [Mycobacterium sp. ACS4331]|uniref:hypothetical protein n=1 Tax=Mycobacterium sp. ACS4331 TaxID=1834121 RepID=UPI0007FD179D|nr:hypothetical protein [Mycobacterium sp. ACS4331]OBF11324.1 hypothetical protein A5727_20505 [Mycobacterium sp. ACS4331]
MTSRLRGTRSVAAARLGVAGLAVLGGALTWAGSASADPAEPAPGVPVVTEGEGLVGPPPPPPAGPPPVPEMANPVYGQGETPGAFGYLRDLWQTARSGDPRGLMSGPPASSPPPPPGAGPAPALPPGFVSLNAPESTTSSTVRSSDEPVSGPPLPPGYYSLNGPPPPGWYDTPPPDPNASLIPIPGAQ